MATTSGMRLSGRWLTSVIVCEMYVYVAKNPPKPIVPISSAIHTWTRFRAPSSRRMLAPGMLASNGTKSAMAPAVSRAITETRAKSSCQPKFWPSQVANGTPMTFATVRPVITMEIAQPRFVAGTRDAAITAAMPK